MKEIKDVVENLLSFYNDKEDLSMFEWGVVQAYKNVANVLCLCVLNVFLITSTFLLLSLSILSSISNPPRFIDFFVFLAPLKTR